MVGYSSHKWCKWCKWSNTCYLFSPLFFFLCFSQVATKFTLTSETSVILLLLKCLSTSCFSVKKAFSSLCSTFFFVLEGKSLSNSSTTEVFEVNVKFVATWLKHWKRKEAKLCSKYYSIIYNIHLKTKKKTNHKRKDQPWGQLSIIFFCFKNRPYTFKN